MNDLRQLAKIHSVEDEPIIQSFYSPNDTYYESSSQCGLRTVNANTAWDLWRIHDLYPSDKSVLLASVDSGVDYTHQDLENNIWINQGEISVDIFNFIDTNLVADNDSCYNSTKVQKDPHYAYKFFLYRTYHYKDPNSNLLFKYSWMWINNR